MRRFSPGCFTCDTLFGLFVATQGRGGRRSLAPGHSFRSRQRRLCCFALPAFLRWPHPVENQQHPGNRQPRHARCSSARNGGGHWESDRKRPSGWTRFRETSRVHCWKLEGEFECAPFPVHQGQVRTSLQVLLCVFGSSNKGLGNDP